MVSFMEVAPENWINVGGRRRKAFRHFTGRFPFVCHGLSLSIGGPSPLDQTFIRKVRQFIDEHQIRVYSEHLSYCTDDGHLYDLMPIPFTGEAVGYVAGRIKQVQDMIGRRMANGFARNGSGTWFAAGPFGSVAVYAGRVC